jgi:hypothetical protein
VPAPELIYSPSKKDKAMAIRCKPARFPDYKPIVVHPSQVERVLKYLRGEIKVPVVDRPITYKSSAK